MNIEIQYLQEAREFLCSMDENARDKMMHNIDMVSKGVKNTRIFKKLKGTELWEFRAEYNGNAYRLFSFWDTRRNALIVATHGIIKKTQKTPARDIEKANQIRLQYFKNN